MIIDAGVFVIMIGTAFGSLFITNNIVRFGFVFKLIGVFLFFALGMMMNAEYDVAFTVTTSDPDGALNVTSGAGSLQATTELTYIIGDGSSSNSNTSWIGWLFILLGLVWAGLFFMDIMSMAGW